MESIIGIDICQKAGAAAGLDKVVVFEVAIFSGLLLMVLVVGAETVV